MENSLANKKPWLVAEWSERNGSISPDDVPYGSKKLYWWHGSCGHEWQASAKARSSGENCPICSNARIVAGINDLASLKPELLKEWSPSNTIQPTEIGVGSHKNEAKQLQQFILEQMEQDKIILIRGNHEDLFVELVTTDAGMPYSYHKSNGTYDTALQLTGFDPVMASIRHYDFADAAKDTPFYKEIIQAMLDYFETEHYVFTHGWIPSIPNRDKSYSYISSWREADREQWNQARWFNGMDAAQTADENKTIVCGHWHTSYGHSKYEHKGTEFGEDADFSPYYGPGIIAIDACTAFSGKVNCLVIED